MEDKSSIQIPKSNAWGKIKEWFFKKLRLTDNPAVKLYEGFGNPGHCQVFGHALTLGPLPRKKYRNIFLFNTLAVLRLFMVKPIKSASIRLFFNDITLDTKTEKDGFFKFEWNNPVPLKPGKYKVSARLAHKSGKFFIAEAHAEIDIPHPSKFAFISDIDDTFLISHSGNLRKRLYVLLTENARSRDPFEGVVNHYTLLSHAGALPELDNSFFYVSSSEWNLYEYIREFIEVHKLPQGVLLLSQMKSFSGVFKTGQNNHKTKFMRIVRILEAFPDQNFILLGDDTQEDPNIYASVIEHFPGQIFCVYIRMVSQKPKAAVEERLREIVKAGTLICYFRHSAEAVIHSKANGIIA
ncbi:MAG: phosphatase domain-containing protein [Ferruginibacter sp.]